MGNTTPIINDAVNGNMYGKFTMLPNDIIRSPKISSKAKTILSILLSNSKGWKSYFRGISNNMKEGDKAIRNGVNELKELGYLVQYRYRDKQKIRGSFISYSTTPFQHNIEAQVKEIEEQGFTLCKEFTTSKKGKAKWQKAKCTKPPLSFSPHTPIIDSYKKNTNKKKKNKEVNDIKFVRVGRTRTIPPKPKAPPRTPRRRATKQEKELREYKAIKNRIIKQSIQILTDTYPAKLEWSGIKYLSWAAQLTKFVEKDWKALKDMHPKKRWRYVLTILQYFKENYNNKYISKKIVTNGFLQPNHLIGIARSYEDNNKDKDTPTQDSIFINEEQMDAYYKDEKAKKYKR